jgi:hypothetical protein
MTTRARIDKDNGMYSINILNYIFRDATFKQEVNKRVLQNTHKNNTKYASRVEDIFVVGWRKIDITQHHIEHYTYLLYVYLYAIKMCHQRD